MTKVITSNLSRLKSVWSEFHSSSLVVEIFQSGPKCSRGCAVYLSVFSPFTAHRSTDQENKQKKVVFNLFITAVMTDYDYLLILSYVVQN